MMDVVRAVQQVTDLMAEIAVASREQSTGIEHVSKAISQTDEVTQQKGRACRAGDRSCPVAGTSGAVPGRGRVRIQRQGLERVLPTSR